MAGNSSVFQDATASGSACQACYSGRCGDNPRVRSSRPTLTPDSATRNSRRISSRTSSRVHNANPSPYCRGLLPCDQHVQPFTAPRRQLRRTTRTGAGLERVPAALPVARQPSVHGAPAHAQRRRHVLGCTPDSTASTADWITSFSVWSNFAAVVLAHTTFLQKPTIKSAYEHSCW